MSTHYRDCNVYDFHRYFGGCTFFKYELGRYSPYMLARNDDEESSRTARLTEAHDWDFMMLSVGEERYDSFEVRGTELCLDRTWIIYRPPVEYVVAHDGHSNKLYRVSFEPSGTRMCKGLSEMWQQYLPLLDYSADTSAMYHRLTETGAGMRVLSTRGSARPLWSSLVQGVANTLSIGACAATRPCIPAVDARVNGKDLVAAVVDGKQEVAVPDFSTAVVSHRARPEALVLHRGKFLGTLKRDKWDGDQIVLYPSRGMVTDKTTRREILHGLKALTTRLLGDRVDWTL